ncbi:helix-turn-helix domain-containing protein [Nocardia cyriacigeorgica]|uniref:helix-turn-helix domain-containing protein n=1 Tax=Nocardia cyriacigeorgica TaxID=135487 RepID=UPI002456CEB8|nr:helix-turn-helix domain-containing protein [Nocardia cyriacigeorgica]
MNEPQAVVDARTAIRCAMALAEAVYLRRTELGLSRGELAERAGLTEAEVSGIEGSDAVPTLLLLKTLARSLDASLQVTIGDDSPRVGFIPHSDIAHSAPVSEDCSPAWLSELDPDDQAEALTEIRAAIDHVAVSRDLGPLWEVLRAWETSVRVMSDPLRRAVHTGPSDGSDYIEVAAPE